MLDIQNELGNFLLCGIRIYIECVINTVVVIVVVVVVAVFAVFTATEVSVLAKY